MLGSFLFNLFRFFLNFVNIWLPGDQIYKQNFTCYLFSKNYAALEIGIITSQHTAF